MYIYIYIYIFIYIRMYIYKYNNDNYIQNFYSSTAGKICSSGIAGDLFLINGTLCFR